MVRILVVPGCVEVEQEKVFLGSLRRGHSYGLIPRIRVNVCRSCQITREVDGRICGQYVQCRVCAGTTERF